MVPPQPSNSCEDLILRRRSALGFFDFWGNWVPQRPEITSHIVRSLTDRCGLNHSPGPGEQRLIVPGLAVCSARPGTPSPVEVAIMADHLDRMKCPVCDGQGEVWRYQLIPFFTDPDLKAKIDSLLGNTNAAEEDAAAQFSRRCAQLESAASHVAEKPKRVKPIPPYTVPLAKSQGVDLLSTVLINRGGLPI